MPELSANSETGREEKARYGPRTHLSDINVNNSGMLGLSANSETGTGRAGHGPRSGH